MDPAPRPPAEPSSPPRPDSNPRRWDRAFIALLLATLALRIAYAAVFPLDLAPDESYYWDWGRRLDIGYYSKPPMIGWLMGLAGWLGGNSFFGLKLFPAILATVGLIFVFLLGRDMFHGRTGFWAVVLLLATPGNAALATFFTIDPPLFCTWSASLWLAWRWWTRPSRRATWGLILAVALGGGYLTKQIQLVFPLLFLAFIAASRSQPRRSILTFQLLAVAVGSLAFLAPPLLWNWKHDWITFRHTTEELQHRPFELSRSLSFLGEFLGGQAALTGGLTWVLMMAGLGLTLRHWKHLDDRHRFLVLLSAPGLAAFLVLSVFQRVEQNWPLVFYPALAVLTSGWLTGEHRGPRPSRRWITAAVGLGAVLGLLLMAVPFVIPASPLAGSKSDPTARVRGWKQLAASVETYRSQRPAPARTFLLTVDDRYVASALAFYLHDQPRTYSWESADPPHSQYGIWGKPNDKLGWDALVIQPTPLPANLASIAARFENWAPLGEFEIRLGPNPARDRHYAVFWGRNFRGSQPSEEKGP